jgi:D-alanine-D-alanine ligase
VTLNVNPDWWKNLFDKVYLLTDARSVCDDEITRKEVDLLCRILPIEPDHAILDLCGGHGRHSFELCARGFCSCTLLDYSRYLLDYARKNAKKLRYKLNIVKADARNTGLSSSSFDHVIIMGNSLGYVPGHESDLQILSEVIRVLRPGGWVLIDVVNGSAVRVSFISNAWHEIGSDIVVCRVRELAESTVYVREMVLSKGRGLIRDQNYMIHFYEHEELCGILKKAGFTRVQARTGFSPHENEGDYGFMSNRMIVTGMKPQ